MKKIYLKLISEYANSKNESSETEIKILKEYEYFTKGITPERIDNLISSIRKVREDWIAFDVTDGSYNIYVTISLLNPFERENEDASQTEIISLLEEFFKPERLLNVFHPTDNNNIDEEIVETGQEESKGILLQIEGYSTIEELELIKELKKKNVKFEYITTNFIATDMGAGSFVAAAIIYILDAAASGIISEVVNTGLAKINPLSQSNIDEQKLDQINYKKLLKDVSGRTNIKVKDLTLINMHKTDEKVTVKFKANDSIVTVICNNQYIIQDLDREVIENFSQSI
ncbi:hypothetical protein [Priestia megaterium]|uniref:hypothetical protein n=1 Tax=Priestia megaterium TaxID=1404 RepID=UPI002E1A5387|nr:hypothetical protein [Priestia megaterium]